MPERCGVAVAFGEVAQVDEELYGGVVLARQEGWLPSTDPDRPHGVVLALLPQDGIGNASSVCTDLFHSYPALECVAMCGIAGGVPAVDDPDRHVRLGDVVVAEEIIGYGHVRRVDGEEVLRRPTGGISADLTRAVHELRIGNLDGVRPWRVWLDGMDTRLAKFRRPAAHTDVLYVAGKQVAHPDPVATGHEEGWPKVHYGRIGSADVLMRDEARRNDLAARYKLLAVEMEASGIASAAALRNRPWFVVRGIVDYCENAGKNDAWHLYSSLAAAAYVRALLGACHPFGPTPRAATPPVPITSDDPPRKRIRDLAAEVNDSQARPSNPGPAASATSPTSPGPASSAAARLIASATSRLHALWLWHQRRRAVAALVVFVVAGAVVAGLAPRLVSEATGQRSSAGRPASAAPSPPLSAQSPGPLPTGECADEKIDLYIGARRRPSGYGPSDVFFLRLHNIGASLCILTVARSIGELSVYDGQSRLAWSSLHCPSSVKQGPSADREVAGKADALPQVEIVWDHRYSTSGCKGDRVFARPGTYTAVWKVGTKQTTTQITL